METMSTFLSISSIPPRMPLTSCIYQSKPSSNLARRLFSPFAWARSVPPSSGSVVHSYGIRDNNANFIASQWNNQFRRYHVSLTQNNFGDDDDKNTEKSGRNNSTQLEESVLPRHNLITRRLYRILLKECKKGVENANRLNVIDGAIIDEFGKGSKCRDDDKFGRMWMLLQPSMDLRKYGFAKIVRARRGNPAPSPEGSIHTNSAISKMSKLEVGMAMEVLKYVHVALGGDVSDDLEEYYLGTKESLQHNPCGSDEKTDDDSYKKSPAIRHSSGHYTQFLGEDYDDEDEENDEQLSKTADDDGGVWQEEDEFGYETEESVLVRSKDLQNAVRIAFRAPLTAPTQSDDGDDMSIDAIVQRRHRDAIDASSLLSEQLSAWAGKSSISIDWERGVRLVASSHSMRQASFSARGGGERSNRFAYRIRVENISDWMTSNQGRNEHFQSLKDAVQLLGRTWKIYERRSLATSSTSLSRLLDEGAIPDKQQRKEKEDDDGYRLTQSVNEPLTGAVGHLPVIRPGEVFEYMSGADIKTPTGAMEGCFHMAAVDAETTDSAHVGDPVEALNWKSTDERKFKMNVQRFGLVVGDEKCED
mmetsp:Transcript_17985/g.37482  ORF Transcript_17985/g.37482 Transcript_17985/m.37482 type:complete len:589 (+) Transcript_17985:35-1801(+)